MKKYTILRGKGLPLRQVAALADKSLFLTKQFKKWKNALGVALLTGIVAGFMSSAFAVTSTGSITPTSGPDSGATATTITIPELSSTASPNAVQTAGNYTLGSDGAVYYIYNPGTNITPAGVTFTSIESWTTSIDEVIAIATDGSAYHATNGGMLTKIPLPTGVTAKQAAANYILGSDGSIYWNDGTKLAGPAGITYTSISAHVFGNPNWFAAVHAIGSDGNVYSATNAGTLTLVTMPASALPAVQTAGNYTLGSDGAIYYNGTKLSAPAGMSFTSIESWTTGQDEVIAIAADGSAWHAINGGALAQIVLPSGVTAKQASGNYVLGSDGNIYWTTGAQLSGPAGMTYTSIGSHVFGQWTAEVHAIGTDGNVYAAINNGTLTLQTLPPTTTTLTVTGVSFGTNAATSYTQTSSTTINATTPTHTAGTVDVVVTTQTSSGAVGPTYTLTQSYTFLDTIPPTAPTVNPSNGQSVSGTAEPGSTVTVKNSAGAVIGTATAGPDGKYTVALSPAQPDGTTLNVTSTDAAGNTSAPASVVVDAKAPLAPTVNPSNGQSVSGTAEPGSTVTVKNSAGAVIGTATAGPDGKYTVALSPAQPDGTTLNITSTDAAGNTSAPASVVVGNTSMAPTAVPAMGYSGLVLLGMLAGLIGLLGLRRTRV
ncbi:Ig-like domain-containing protein [Comamonas odontotermitis]|uniref:Ig-like domain-containing protein n=1 Tax=Comamonas odontotermitis TaxID=379895 RepID=UPI00366CB0B2